MVHGTRIKIMVQLHNYGTVWQRCCEIMSGNKTKYKGVFMPLSDCGLANSSIDVDWRILLNTVC